MTSHSGTWRTTGTLAIGGGLAFWSATFAISLTPIAAEYRAALSIAYLPMLFEVLVGGLILGLGTGYSLIRLHHVFPDKSPVLIPALGVAMGYLYRRLVTTDRRERLQNGTYA